MPLFDFFNETTGETREVFFHMNDVKQYNGEDGAEVGQWRRLFHAPMAAIDTKFDPNNRNDFIRRGEKYKDLGSLMDKSKELSEKRESKEGVDQVKRQFFDKYAADRNGKKHIQDRKTKIDTPKVTVEI